MFNIMDMMGKLQDTQKKIENTKKRLDTVLIDEVSTDNAVKVTVTANRLVKSIEISEDLLSDKEQLEDFLILTLNKALARAEKIQEQELAIVAKEGIPNIPGLF